MRMNHEAMTAEGQAVAKGIEQVLSRLSQEGRAVSNLILFFAAPFIGLAYIIAFPFIGFSALAGVLVQAALAERS